MSKNINPILQLFPVNSKVNMYEAYTEFWARIMNALFCSFINMKNKNDIDEFYTNTEFFINFERIFAFFQMIKILDFIIEDTNMRFYVILVLSIHL